MSEVVLAAIEDRPLRPALGVGVVVGIAYVVEVVLEPRLGLDRPARPPIREGVGSPPWRECLPPIVLRCCPDSRESLSGLVC